MQERLKRLSPILALCLITLLTTTVAAPASAQDVLIRGGWLFDGTGDEVVPNPGIFVRASKFLAVGGDLTEHETATTRVIELEKATTFCPASSTYTRTMLSTCSPMAESMTRDRTPPSSLGTA